MTTVGRNLVERIHCAGCLRRPYTLELLVLDEHTEFGGLLIVVDDRQRVTLLEEIPDEHVVLRPSLANLTLDEKREHLTGGHLIVAGRIRLQLLDGEGIADDVGMVDDRILQINMDDVAHQLLSVVPHDRIVVECHDGVLRVVDERVADGLHIATESPHVVVGVDLAIDGVGLDVEGDELERVGM